jgi:hypothetical protein
MGSFIQRLYKKINDSPAEAGVPLTPTEFLAYLLDNNKVNGVHSPIEREQLSIKVSGRGHYVTEIINKSSTLPKSFIHALVAMTGKPVAFWHKTSFTLADAESICINMDADIPNLKKKNWTQQVKQEKKEKTIGG